MEKEINKKNWFTNKITVYIMLGFILLFELLAAISTVAQAKNKIHWMVFLVHLVLLLLATGSFLFYYFKKVGWMRAFMSIIVFVECIYTIAYSFMAYPKTPDQQYTGFVIYIMYGCMIFSLFINLLVLNAHMSETRDASALKAFTIQIFIYSAFSAIFFLYSLVKLCTTAFTAIMFADTLSYASSCLMLWYILHAEKITMPLVIQKYYGDKK